MANKVFISYSRKQNAGFAYLLEDNLGRAGLSVWIDKAGISTGSRWDQAIETALRETDCLIVVLSPAAIASDNVMDEVYFALDIRKQIIPIMLEDCEMPMRIRRFQYIDFRIAKDEHFKRLLTELGHADKINKGNFLPFEKPPAVAKEMTVQAPPATKKITGSSADKLEAAKILFDHGEYRQAAVKLRYITYTDPGNEAAGKLSEENKTAMAAEVAAAGIVPPQYKGVRAIIAIGVVLATIYFRGADLKTNTTIYVGLGWVVYFLTFIFYDKRKKPLKPEPVFTVADGADSDFDSLKRYFDGKDEKNFKTRLGYSIPRVRSGVSAEADLVSLDKFAISIADAIRLGMLATLDEAKKTKMLEDLHAGAALGCGNSFYTLGLLYQKGMAVFADEAKAQEYFESAKNAGNAVPH